MSYAHDRRAKNKRRARLHPERFKNDVPDGKGWSHWEQPPRFSANLPRRKVVVPTGASGSLA